MSTIVLNLCISLNFTNSAQFKIKPAIVSKNSMKKPHLIILSLIATLFIAFVHADDATQEKSIGISGNYDNQPSLDTVRVCKYTLTYEDKGSGGDDDVSIYAPHAPAGYYVIGGYAQGDYHKTSACVIVVKPSSTTKNDVKALMVSPIDWDLVWTDEGSGADMDGSVWHPVSPDDEYVCIGSVGQAGYNKPLIPNYRCLHRCLLEKAKTVDYIWSDIGTGARQQVSLYKLRNSGMFYANAGRKKPSGLMDLKSNPVCMIGPDTTDKKHVGTEWVNPDAPQKPSSPPIASSAVSKKPVAKEWVNPDAPPKPSSPPEKMSALGKEPVEEKWVNPDVPKETVPVAKLPAKSLEKFNHIKNAAIGSNAYYIEEGLPLGLEACAEKCLQMDACLSFAYHNLFQECELYNVKGPDAGATWYTNIKSYDYYEKISSGNSK